jgi:hypothetical protein
VKRSWALIVSLGSASIALACGSDRTDRPTSTVVPSGECPTPDPQCDIRESDCQLAVLQLTACVRGDGDVPMPALRVISSEQFRDELVARYAMDAHDDQLADAALSALHLLPSGMSSIDAAVEAQVDGVAAFYDDETKGVTIIDSGQLGDAQEAVYELSHELTHYLQDRSVGLRELVKLFPNSNDGSVASRNLIEGEAVVTSTRALLIGMQRAVNHVLWGTFFDHLDGSLLANVSSAPARLQAAELILPYAVGSRYVGEVWNGYDRAHVDDLFADAPRAVVDWLAGYGIDVPSATLVQPLDCGPPQAPSGFVLEELDSFGPTGVLALLGAAGAADDLSLASALRNDALAVYDGAGAGSSTVLAAWRLRFDSSVHARAFASALSPLGFASKSFGSELVLSASSDQHNPLTGQLFDGCPKLDELRPRLAADSGMAAFRRGLPHHARLSARSML